MKVNCETYYSEKFSISQDVVESMIDHDYYKIEFNTIPIHLMDFF